MDLAHLLDIGLQASEAVVAAAAAPVAMPKELSEAELAKLSKDERKAYHQARRQALQAQEGAVPKKEVSKAERRAIQEAQRKVKETVNDGSKEEEEILAEMKMAGLSEVQAKEMLRLAALNEPEGEVQDSDEDDEDLLGSVNRWMTEQGSDATTKDSLSDFNMKVRFQGHVDSTPPDHVACVLEVVIGKAWKGGELAACKPQPNVMAKKITPFLTQWVALIGGLYTKVGDVLEAANMIVTTISNTVAKVGAEAPDAVRQCAVVGFLMAIREEIDSMEDEELLPACRRLESGGKVMEKFVEFLEEEVAGSDEDDDDE